MEGAVSVAPKPSRRQLLLLAIAAFMALTLMGNVGQNLSAMHVSGGTGSGVTSIASPGVTKAKGQAVVQQWSRWYDQRKETVLGLRHEHDSVKQFDEVTAAPGTLVEGWLLLDSLVFVPALLFLLRGLVRRRRAIVAADSSAEWFLKAGMWAAVAYAVSDELENVTTWVAIFRGDPFAAVQAFSALKWLSLGTTVAILLASFLPRLSGGDGKTLERELGPTVRALRVPILVATLAALVQVALPANVGGQLKDVVRSWVVGDRFGTAVVALVGLILVTVMLAAIARVVTVREAKDHSGKNTLERTAVSALVTVGVVALIGRSTYATVFVLITVVIVGVVGVFLSGSARPPEMTPRLPQPRRGVAQLVVVLPALAFTTLVLRSVNLAGPASPKAQLLMWAVAGLVVAAAGWRWALPRGSHAPSATVTRAATAIVILFGLGGAIVGVRVMQSPLATGWWLGSFGVLWAWLLVVGLLFFALERLWWQRPRGLLGAVGLARFPIVIPLVLLTQVVSAADTSNGFHRVRVLEDRPARAVEAPALTATVTARAKGAVAASTGAPPTVVPVFVIASSGGGGRAAYWTMTVLDCLFDQVAPPNVGGSQRVCPATKPRGMPAPPAWENVIAASGISGGSVGLAMYSASKTVGKHCGVPPDPNTIFHRGLLDPTFASLLFVDSPNSLLRQHGWKDRAWALERSMEAELPSMRTGLFAQQAGRTTACRAKGVGELTTPVLLLNSAAAHDGCRINVAAVNLTPGPGPTGSAAERVLQPCRTLAPASSPPHSAGDANARTSVGPLTASRDVSDWMCAATKGDAPNTSAGRDLRLSTASLLSARFPVVSPTGALRWCTGVKLTRKNERVAYAVDGGLVDSSAASPMSEILRWLLTNPEARDGRTDVCLQPVVLQIDNGYEDSSVATAPTLGQLAALRNQASIVGKAAADIARQDLADLAA
ncbi:MAG: hypothetical protein QOK28_897, partial [Actinomycetota bacterium]